MIYLLGLAPNNKKDIRGMILMLINEILSLLPLINFHQPLLLLMVIVVIFSRKP